MADELNITVKGVEPQRGGLLTVFIFQKEGFPKRHQQAIHSLTKRAEDTNMVFSFNVDLEEFAVKVWHDEDESGKITKNWTGIYPKEGLGFSNGQRVTTFGPPKYKKSKLNKKQVGENISITIVYP